MSLPADAPRTEGARIARNSAVLGAGEIAGMVLGFATNVIVVRLLGDQGYGLLIGAQRFVGWFLVLVQFGLHPLLIRWIAARHGEPGTVLGTALALRGGLSLVFAAAVFLGAQLFDYLPGHTDVLMAFVVIELLGVAVESWIAVCDGLERMGRSALTHFAAYAPRFLGVLWVLRSGGGLPEVLIVYAGSRALQLGAAIWLTKGAAPDLRLRVDWGRVRPILREALLFVGIGAAFRTLVSMDVMLLTRLAGEAQAGRYGAALVFLDPLLLLPSLVQRALLPAFSRLEGDAGGGGDIARDSLQILCLVLIPAAVGLSLLAPQAVALYGSDEFGDSASVLAVLAVAIVFAGPMVVAAAHLTGAGRLSAILWCYALALPVQLAANLVLIPRYGAVGAACASVSAYAILSVGLLRAVRELGASPPLAALLRYALGAAALGAAVMATRQQVLPVPVLAGTLAYAAVVWLLTPRKSLERRLLAALAQRWRGA